MLQVLALDIGTDVLPALALGAEPPARDVLDRPPSRGHLLDRTLFTRAFGILGPVEAAVALTAFLVTFLAAGWRPGEGFPGGGLMLAASGAAFTAVVFGQAANAFACRSTRRQVWRLGWRTNRLLLGAVLTDLAMLPVYLYLPLVAGVLGHAGPSWPGKLCALLAVPAVLTVDALSKHCRRR